MVRIIINGALGHMGKVVERICGEDERLTVVAGVDIEPREDGAFPVYASLLDVKEEADAVIDFSTAAAVDALLAAAVEKKLPLVLCTTGLSEAQLDAVNEASKQIPILRSANMSLGINLLIKLLKQAAGVLVPSGYDAEIVEMHHRRKLDAPSGTALALADSVNEGAGGNLSPIFDRSGRRAPREAGEIGVSSVRGGTIVGVHDVIFAGEDEVITFTHTAYSRAIFAKGAAEAAVFLAGREAGLYDMSDVIG